MKKRRPTSVSVNANIVPGVLWRFVVNSVKNPQSFRFGTIRGAWNLIKLQAARTVRNIPVHRIKGIDRVNIEIAATSYDRAVLCAITRIVQPKTFFEIGTYLGETTLAVARSNPQSDVYTLDLPSPESRTQALLETTDEFLFERWDRGSVFHSTPEEARIHVLSGDSAVFNFNPYFGKIDVVFIDASHSYSYVKADTEAGLKMLSPRGTILWHDYPAYPGVFAWLNELGAHLDRKIYHVLGTGLAFSSRLDLVE